MDFHRVNNQIVSIYYDCDISSLIHRGENLGPGEIVETSKKGLENQEIGDVVTKEYSAPSRCYRWIHLAVNSVSQIYC